MSYRVNGFSLWIWTHYENNKRDMENEREKGERGSRWQPMAGLLTAVTHRQRPAAVLATGGSEERGGEKKRNKKRE